jgi:protocatechuate 3,4-dioxygenase beta subunit
LFIVGGIAQVFWLLPMVRKWGKIWYSLGIAGNFAFFAIWLITRFPGNPITGRGNVRINSIEWLTEAAQLLFIGLAIAIIAYESRRTTRKKETAVSAKTINSVAPSKREKDRGIKPQTAALVCIMAALVLSGFFALPVLMPRPAGAGGGGSAPQAVGGAMQFGGSPTQQAEIPISQQITTIVRNCTLTPSLVEVEDTPQQIEGPYFVDEMLNRSDIRSDPSDGSVQQGIPLNLIMHIYNISKDGSGSCIPLRAAKLDIWHANSQGLYSDIPSIGTEGKKYLRGYQITDNNGIARFTTIYPGWYQGRAIHIHVKVRTFEGSEKTFEWTSQLYLNNSINTQVHLQAPYNKHGLPPITNEQDSIYTGPSTDGIVQSNTGQHLMLHVTGDNSRGYVGTFNIGVEANQ